MTLFPLVSCLSLGPVRCIKRGFLGGSDGKEPACNAGDPGLIPGSERSPGEWNGYPLQYFCLENSMDRGAWRASPWGCKELVTSEQLSLLLSSLSLLVVPTMSEPPCPSLASVKHLPLHPSILKSPQTSLKSF